jgi:hypothetical protein
MSRGLDAQPDGGRRVGDRTPGSIDGWLPTVLNSNAPPSVLDVVVHSSVQQSGSSCNAAAPLLAAICPNPCNPRPVIAYEPSEASTNELAICNLGADACGSGKHARNRPVAVNQRRMASTTQAVRCRPVRTSAA